MSLKTVKNLAARVLGVGVSRLRIRDEAKAKDALSADDVRALSRDGAIEVIPETGVGRGKAKLRALRRPLGRRAGSGRRKGTSNAVVPAKTLWIRKLRSQRELLTTIKPTLKPGVYAKLYRRVKGNNFRDRRQLLTFINENDLRTDKK